MVAAQGAGGDRLRRRTAGSSTANRELAIPATKRLGFWTGSTRRQRRTRRRGLRDAQKWRKASSAAERLDGAPVSDSTRGRAREKEGRYRRVSSHHREAPGRQCRRKGRADRRRDGGARASSYVGADARASEKAAAADSVGSRGCEAALFIGGLGVLACGPKGKPGQGGRRPD
jgi:hypothetical protein